MTHTEETAKRIYELMRFDDHGNRVGPDWVEGGNSVRQEQARRFAKIGFECAATYLEAFEPAPPETDFILDLLTIVGEVVDATDTIKRQGQPTADRIGRVIAHLTDGYAAIIRLAAARQSALGMEAAKE